MQDNCCCFVSGLEHSVGQLRRPFSIYLSICLSVVSTDLKNCFQGVKKNVIDLPKKNRLHKGKAMRHLLAIIDNLIYKSIQELFLTPCGKYTDKLLNFFFISVSN